MTTTYATETFDAKAFDAAGNHTGPGPWLAVIHAVNGMVPGTFGEPTTEAVDLIGGGTRYVEHYPEFDVVFLDAHPDTPQRKQVSIIALTQDAANLLADAKELAA